MKKTLILLAALFFLILGGACLTPKLYDEESRTFEEEVSTFLITEDGKQLIVVGKQHHYIFAANETLKFILTWPEKKRVKAAFSNFIINNSNQTVSGSYTLTVDAGHDLAPEARKLLVSKGFKEPLKIPKSTFSIREREKEFLEVPFTHSTPQKTLSYRGSVQGTRYLADKFVLPATLQLNQKYTITMRENYVSTSATIGRILLTPLAVAADGVLLVIGGIPVLLFAIAISSAH